MTLKVHAVYESGALRLDDPLPIPDGTRVEVTLDTNVAEGPDPRRAAEILRAIAAMPMESSVEGFTGRDHDAVLYGASRGR